jgi:hypothetical protein
VTGFNLSLLAGAIHSIVSISLTILLIVVLPIAFFSANVYFIISSSDLAQSVINDNTLGDINLDVIAHSGNAHTSLLDLTIDANAPLIGILNIQFSLKSCVVIGLPIIGCATISISNRSSIFDAKNFHTLDTDAAHSISFHQPTIAVITSSSFNTADALFQTINAAIDGASVGNQSTISYHRDLSVLRLSITGPESL